MSHDPEPKLTPYGPAYPSAPGTEGPTGPRWRAADVSLAVVLAVLHGIAAFFASFVAVLAGAGTYGTACKDQVDESACGTQVNLAAALAGLGPWGALVVGIVLAVVVAQRGRPAVLGVLAGMALGIACLVAGAALMPD